MTSVTSRESQQQFYEKFGSRDYDCFKSSEEKYLKLKIAINLFGFPQQSDAVTDEITVATCYDVEQNKMIDAIFKKIQKYRNWDTDDVYVASLFNCCELKRTTREKQSQSKQQYAVFPVMRVKKCFGNAFLGNNCCIFIDEHARVYQNWEDYLLNNKLPKAQMIIPKNGKYVGNSRNQVLLEERPSPESSAGNNFVKSMDMTNTVISLASGGVAVASLIPAITIAPFLLTGALVSGVGVGIYSTIRSSTTLHDRRTHGQSISLNNSEARNCYLNIAAGTAGVLTTGATKAATIAIDKGITVSQNTAKILLGVNLFNMTVASANSVNSVHSIISDVKNNKNPSALDIIQLSAATLFFGNAVVNLKTATTIYKQSRSISFSEMVRSRSQDMWLKAKNTFYNSDVTTMESNYSITNIDTVGDYCFTQLSAMPKKIYQTSNNIMPLIDNISQLETVIKLGFHLYKNRENVFSICKIILQRFEIVIQEHLLAGLKWFVKEIAGNTFDVIGQLFPHSEIVEVLLIFLRNFCQLKATEMEIEYQGKKARAMRISTITDEGYDKQHSDCESATDRLWYFFKICVLKMICSNGRPDEIFLRELQTFFWDWLIQKITLHENRVNIRQHSIRYKTKIPCHTCGGFNYNN